MNEEPTAEHDEPGGLAVAALLESLLFVAQEPVSVERLAAVLETSVEAVQAGLEQLDGDYARRGLRLQRKGDQVQMVSAPEAADVVRRLLGLELSSRLSPAALETLAVVAYRQPVTRAEIESVRGVNSDTALRTLVHRGLVEEQGRLERAGRPMVYGTTFEFLQQFGLRTLDQLPSPSPGDAPKVHA
jgi:segregation and condensation protein B